MAILKKADPLKELLAFQQQLNKLFQERLERSGEVPELGAAEIGPLPAPGGARGPAIDLYETDTKIVLHAEVPGVNPEEIVVEIAGKVLTLRGENRSSGARPGEVFHRMEREQGAFTRSFTLPRAFDPRSLQRTYREGVLRVVLEKSKGKD